MSAVKRMLSKVKKVFGLRPEKQIFENYWRLFQAFAFQDLKCRDKEQYEASITRLSHTIEKGLSYRDYRPGFGRPNVGKLIESMQQYANKFGTNDFFYEMALSCLMSYVEKNHLHGWKDEALEKRIQSLPGKSNGLGGTIEFSPLPMDERRSFCDIMENRHSVRDFSEESVDTDQLIEAVKLAQHTPSACNRQGWHARIIQTPKLVQAILSNQNGNKGFGDKIDKLILVTGDIRYFQKGREVFQPFIDAGMYAANILNALEVYGIGSIPLSAALLPEQEKNVRQISEMEDAEVLILIIGVGRRPAKCLTCRSQRKDPIITVH